MSGKKIWGQYVAMEKERDALRAKVDAMERQEPVAWARKLAMGLPSFGCVTDLKYRPSDMPESAYMPLYALPGTQPAPSVLDGWIQRGMAELETIRNRLDDDTLLDDRTLIERIGKAMLAAAPEANHDPR